MNQATSVRSWLSILSGVVLVCLPIGLSAASATIHREDLFTTSHVGIRIHLREVRPDAHQACRPILLVHGARVPGMASFDLPVAGGSLAGDLADRGFCAYVMDVRGYGQSTRPPEMEQPPQNHPPLVRSVEAVRDVDAAVDFIQQRTGASRVSLLGWATGGQWAGYYATLHSHKLSHLILLNALYGADAPHPLMGHGSDMEDPARFEASRDRHAGHCGSSRTCIVESGLPTKPDTRIAGAAGHQHDGRRADHRQSGR